MDEYQDTNFAQYRFIRLLADSHQNLCVVGDDHQSIYAFRGADYKNILEFESDFPDAVVVKLEQNYRSSANILNNANTLIGHNQSGRKKNLWTENDPGEPVQIQEVLDEKEEGRFIADTVKALERTEVPLRNIAVLYRMNAQSRAIEEALMRNQIPYQIVGGTRFFDRREIKDIVAYLRIIFNPRDDVSFLRVINVPSRKIGAASLEIIKKYANEYGLSMFDILEEIESMDELPESKKTVFKNFRDMILRLQKKMNLHGGAAKTSEEPEKNSHFSGISELLEELIEQIKFYRWLDDGSADGEIPTTKCAGAFFRRWTVRFGRTPPRRVFGRRRFDL